MVARSFVLYRLVTDSNNRPPERREEACVTGYPHVWIGVARGRDTWSAPSQVDAGADSAGGARVGIDAGGDADCAWRALDSNLNSGARSSVSAAC